MNQNSTPPKAISPINKGYTRKALLLLLCLLPFSPFLITFLGTFVGQNIIINSWKEILLFIVFMVLCLKSPKTFIHLARRSRAVQIIIAYVLFLGVVLFMGRKDLASGAGFVFAVRFLLAFIVGLMAWKLIAVADTTKKLIYIAIIICLIGFVVLLLPNQLLTHVGYDAPGMDTLNNPASIHYVSEGLNIERMMSTFKSPNSLGLYLLLPLALVLFAKKKSSLTRALLALFTFSVISTFSRSAFIGLLFIAVYYTVEQRSVLLVRIKKLSVRSRLAVVVSSLLLLVALVPVSSRLLFHQESGNDNGSTSVRITQYQKDIKNIVAHPSGNGLGTASLAGRVNGKGVVVSENYYLQIGRESGIIGLVLFLGILIYLYKDLKTLNGTTRSVLIASFFALSIASLFIPVWADEVVAITWWLFAGLVLGKQLGASVSTNTEEVL